jgi:hypothetical protein
MSKILELLGLEKVKKKIVCLDFDGVIHSYKKPWINARTIPDEPVKGMIEWIENFIEVNCDIPESICAMSPDGKYEINIYSSRSKYFGGIKAMKKYLVNHGLDYRYLEVIKFPTKKPAAFITIDDRVICFDGKVDNLNDMIFNFKPWNKRGV